jgi:hypothetical protein
MIVSYGPGIDLLTKNLPELTAGHVRSLILVLSLDQHDRLLTHILRAARTLDDVSGPHSVVILFAPPPIDLPNRYSDITSGPVYCGEYGSVEAADWPAFRQRMHEETLQIARYFSVPLTRLPALACLDVDSPQSVAIVPIPTEPDWDRVLHGLMTIYVDWYGEHRDKLEDYDYMLDLAHYRRFGKTSRRVKARQNERITQELLPLLNAAVLRELDGMEVPDRAALARALARMRDQPRNINVLQQALRKNNLAIMLKGERVDWAQLPSVFARLQREFEVTREQALAYLQKHSQALPSFPVGRFRRLGTDVSIEKLKGALGNVKSVIDLVSSLRTLAGLP